MDTMTLNPVTTPSVNTASAYVQTASAQRSETHVENNTASSLQQEQDNKLSLDAQKKILQESTEKFNEMSDTLNLDVKFAYNDKIDQVYLNVIDKNTGKIIRKLPSEEAMKISESMKELVGNLLDKKG